jgi:TolB-like protein/class 3 adenylate cyclase/tetratricopeptide (TPR) repeat protein
VERRLAAILAADVVGYSRLIEADEAGTLAALKERWRNVFTPLVTQHHGRVVRVMGDGVLVEFASAVNAVQCGIDLQKRMGELNIGLPDDRCVVLRMGITLGDVIVDGGNLYGEGVNVAARLEAMAEPGGLCISGSVYDQIKRKLGADFVDIGLQSLKNMADPVHVYRMRPRSPAGQREDEADDAPLALPAEPSIAILPFVNMSNEPEHEFFADGLTEDLITDLSQAPGLFVIARSSSFAYQGKRVDVRTIARDLGVRHILEGSARRAAGRVRINVQLIDATGGGHLLADSFDRRLEDIFEVRDEVVAKVVEALVGPLTTEIPKRKRPANLDAYDLCVRGRALIWRSPLAGGKARLLFERAIALDPGFAEAHRWLAVILQTAWLSGEPTEPNRRLALATAQKAAELDPNDSGTRWVFGILLTREQRWMEADAEFATALGLGPSNADAWAFSSELMLLSGRPAEAIARIRKAIRLNPHPPGWYYWFLGGAEYLDGQYDRAVKTLRREETYRTVSRRTLAASLAQLGRLDEARREAEFFMASNPDFTISDWADSNPFRDKAAGQHFVDGYQKAGLPE